MQPAENWGPTHKNIERLQRRSITSANASRKNSSVRIAKDPTVLNSSNNNQPSAPNAAKQAQSNGNSHAAAGSSTNGALPQLNNKAAALNGGPPSKIQPGSRPPASGGILHHNNGDCSSSSSELTTVTPTNLSQKSNPHCSIIMDEASTKLSHPLASKGGAPPVDQTAMNSKPTKPRIPSTSDSAGSFDNPSFDVAYVAKPKVPLSKQDSDKNKETKI